jgi:hypothetical protein
MSLLSSWSKNKPSQACSLKVGWKHSSPFVRNVRLLSTDYTPDDGQCRPIRVVNTFLILRDFNEMLHDRLILQTKNCASTVSWKEPTFPRSMSPPSSGPKNNPSHKAAGKQSQALRRGVPPKRRVTFRGLVVVKSLNTALSVTAAMGTSNPTNWMKLKIRIIFILLKILGNVHSHEDCCLLRQDVVWILW